METKKDLEILRQKISDTLKTMTSEQLKGLKNFIEKKKNEI